MSKIKVGIIGAAGYTGGELLRVLITHPDVEISYTHSDSHKGELISTVHSDFSYLLPERYFDGGLKSEVDVVFLCVAHGEARKYIESGIFSSQTKIIDLSQDHRLKADAQGFVYGLAEVNRALIKKARYVANPGCFATAIELALFPLMEYIQTDIHITALTGSTGAGVKPSASTHFSWRSHNLSVYKAFNHQHLAEICELLAPKVNINFVPLRGGFTRGILASIYFKADKPLSYMKAKLESYYQQAKFVKVINELPDVKRVVNTNFCLLNIQEHDGYIHVVSVIDNLLKGAVGQAVQNMNLMCHCKEDAALILKPLVH